MDTAGLVAALKSPEAYPSTVGPVGEVGFLETHISLLFFAGPRVYKVKKPVDLGFLDFTALEDRERFCADEVRLNSRLAPGVYLGVVPVVRDAGGRIRMTGDGEVVEWAVEMVRLPSERMFDRMLARGEIDNSHIRAVVERLTRFHAAVATGPGVDEHGAPEAIAANVEENFEQIRGFVGPIGHDGEASLSPAQYELLATRARGFLAARRGLLEERVRAGRIREGHGDLHAGNLCFTEEGLVAYDCIEFNRRFRCGDVASDLAFLAMDLDYRGFPGFARFLVRAYAKLAGDPELADLVPFYKEYRAVVRGKVASLTAASAGLDAERRRALRGEAARYFQLAVGYELPPALVLMCGLPASGKSWLAQQLVAPLRAVLLHSDVRRKTLAGLAPATRVRAGYEAGLYSPEQKRRTYRSLLGDAARKIRAGRTVIVDATFSKDAYRAPFVDAAARSGIPCLLVHVRASDAVIRERLAERARSGAGASDADLGVYRKARESFEPPVDGPACRVVEVDSGEESAEAQVARVIDRAIGAA